MLLKIIASFLKNHMLRVYDLNLADLVFKIIVLACLETFQHICYS